MAKQSSSHRILALVESQGVIRPKQLEALGIPKVQLYRLVRQGLLKRVGRGLYTLPERASSAHESLVEASSRVPQGVICLLSALRLHEIGTQSPFEVWMAIEQKAWRPKIEYPPLRIIQYSGEAYHAGIEVHEIDGSEIRVYCPAKTIADCFKHRNKIGIDVAIEALKEGWRAKRFTMDNLERYARICRVSQVMRPYLEVLVG
jgi:predicted transcriptional regulator of viral defense system